MSYGITQTGFVKKNFITILNDKLEKAKLYFGQSIDLRPTSTIYKFMQLQAFEEANLWDMAEQFWYSMFISTASGVALELIGEDRGLRKQDPTKAIGTVEFTGNNYANIPIGTIVTTFNLEQGVIRFKTTVQRYIGQVDNEVIDEDTYGAGPTFTLANVPANPLISVLWWDDSANGGSGAFITMSETTNPDPGMHEFYVNYTTGEITIDTTGSDGGLDTDDFLRITYVAAAETTTEIGIECLEYGGKGNVPSNTIVNLETSVSGISALTNPEATSGGNDIESDNSFRRRLLEQPRTVFSTEQIESEVENVQGVRSALIIEGVRREVFYGQTGGISSVTLDRIPQDPLREVKWYDYSTLSWNELSEGTSPLGPFEYEPNFGTGEITLGSDLDEGDQLTVLYVDNEIGTGVFLVLIDPLVSPLTAEVENEIAAALDNVRPSGIAYVIQEIDKIGILVDVDITLDVGFVLEEVAEQIDKFIRYYIDGPSSQSEEEEAGEYTGLGVGETIVRNELIRIIMSRDGVYELTDLTIQIEDEPIEPNIISGNTIQIATVSDGYPYGTNEKIYGGKGKTGTEYVEGTDWSRSGNDITWISTPTEAVVYFNYKSIVGNAEIGETQAPDYRGGVVS